MKLAELNEMTKGLVLSGGGIRAMAHIGAIKALQEREILPDMVSGASTGAIVGALYANGTSPVNMLAFFKETPLFKYNFFTVNKPGLFDIENYLFFLSNYFEKDAFDALEKKLFVTVTDLQSGNPKVFSTGKLFRPLLASAALPPVISPITIDGRLFADGGIMDNFPLGALANKADFIIGCHTSGIREIGKTALENPSQLAKRTYRLMLHANCREKLWATDILIQPKDLEYIKVMDNKGIEKAYLLGYDHASRCLDSFLEA